MAVHGSLIDGEWVGSVDVMVNLPAAGVDYPVPFGGRKASSYGPREQGACAQEFYTRVKTACIAP